jgi:hypothetical protein
MPNHTRRLENMLQTYLSSPVDYPDIFIGLDELWRQYPDLVPRLDLQKKIKNSYSDLLRDYLSQAKQLTKRKRREHDSSHFKMSAENRSRVQELLIKNRACNSIDIFTMEPLLSIPAGELHFVRNPNNRTSHCYWLPDLYEHVVRNKTNPLTNLQLDESAVLEIVTAAKTVGLC